MGTSYGVNKTLQRAGVVNSIEPELVGGAVKWVYDSFTFDGVVTTGEVIHLMGCLLPVEARIVEWIIDCGALGGSCTLEFGTLADPNEFMDATNLGSAAVKALSNGNGIAGSLGFEVEAGDGQIPTLVVGAGTPTNGIVVKVGIAYVAKG
ncbi:MAG: hypothetical protein WC312_03855 [Candidatus Omnitrophota bacterium]|jgi:hypothetical protein